MSQFIGFLVVILVMLAVFFVAGLIKKSELEGDRGRIETYLNQKGYQIYSLEHHQDPFDPNSKHVYRVVYVDSELGMYKIRCMKGAHQDLYWSDPKFSRQLSRSEWNDMLRLKAAVEAGEADPFIPSPEMPWDKLTSVYKYERLEALKQIVKSGYIDDETYMQIAKLAETEKDREVKDAAKDLIAANPRKLK